MRKSLPPKQDFPSSFKIGITVIISTVVLAMLTVQFVVSMIVLALVLVR